jgi:hypothetical protein
MTLLETEKIGKELVKKGYHRNSKNHQHYRTVNDRIAGAHVEIAFHNLYSNHWYADIKFDMDMNTVVKYKGHSKFFTPEWVASEGKKLRALFNFMRS